MRTEKTILRRVAEWKNDAKLTPGVYRLFTYIKWESIPEEYKSFFPKEAQEKWNDDLKDFKEDDIRRDLDAEIKAVFRGLFGKKIMQSLSIMPIILADMYVLGYPTAKAQAKLSKLTKDFVSYVDVDLRLAEANAIFDIVDLLDYIIKATKLDTDINLKNLLDNIIATNKLDDLTKELPVDIYAQVDAALFAHSLKEQGKE